MIVTVFGMQAKLVRHEVQRGETWLTICRDYGVSFDDLKRNNTWLNSDTDCLAGLEIDVPVNVEDGDMMVNRLLVSDSRYIEAQRLFDSGDYKKAVKIYDKIVKSDVGPYAAYFLRGRAQLMRGKYGQAIDDFSSASLLSFTSIDDYRDEAIRLKEEQSAQRAEMWGNIALGVATAAVVTTEAIAQNKASQRNSQSSDDNTVTSPYDVVTPMGKVIKAPKSITKLMNGEYDVGMKVTYDQYGNMMVYSPGGAKMTEDIANETAQMAVKAAAAHPGNASLVANAQWALSNQRIQLQQAQYERTPHYLMEYDQQEINKENERLRQERRAYYEDERELTKQNSKNLSKAMLGHETSSEISSQSHSSTSISPDLGDTQKKSIERRSTLSDDNGSRNLENDSKQQYKTEMVSSDDYKEIKKIDLYYRDGGKYHLKFSKVSLCQKGAYKYVKIGDKYYLRTTPNSSAFKHAIAWGSIQLYYN